LQPASGRPDDAALPDKVAIPPGSQTTGYNKNRFFRHPLATMINRAKEKQKIESRNQK
jgi:hypothetical protein